MKANQLARLKSLEEMLQLNAASSVWIDMWDERLRVDVNHRRGEEMSFDSVREAANWLETQIKDSDQITGVILIDDISELFEGQQRESLSAAFVEGEERGVVMNMVAFRGSLAGTALATWLWTANINERLVSRKPSQFAILYVLAEQIRAEFPIPKRLDLIKDQLTNRQE